MKKRMKTFVVLGLCFGLLASILTGCSGGNQPAETSSAETTPAADEGNEADPADDGDENNEASTSAGTVLAVAASQNWIWDVDKDLAKAFEAETGIAIDFQLSPDDQYQTIIKSKLNTGEGPDVFYSYSGTKLKDFNPEKNMVDLSGESWVANMEQWALDGSAYKGGLYGQNTAGVDGTNGVLYQPAMFEEYGLDIPTTYEEFKAVCDTLLENGVTPIYELVKDLWHAHYWMEGVSGLAVQNNPDLYEQLNTNQIGFADVPEYVEALEQMQEMEAAGYFGENHMSNIYENSYEAINSGEYAMIIIHGSYPNEMADSIDGVTPDNFSMFPNPLVDNDYLTLTAGGYTKCINSNSDNIDAAKLYLEFLARPENLEKLYSEKTIFVSSSVKGVEASPTKAFKDLEDMVGDKKVQGAEASVYFYDGGKISELSQEMFVGGLTAKEVLEEFDNARRALGADAGEEGF